jgi:hypothetical protein
MVLIEFTPVGNHVVNSANPEGLAINLIHSQLRTDRMAR